MCGRTRLYACVCVYVGECIFACAHVCVCMCGCARVSGPGCARVAIIHIQSQSLHASTQTQFFVQHLGSDDRLSAKFRTLLLQRVRRGNKPVPTAAVRVGMPAKKFHRGQRANALWFRQFPEAATRLHIRLVWLILWYGCDMPKMICWCGWLRH